MSRNDAPSFSVLLESFAPDEQFEILDAIMALPEADDIESPPPAAPEKKPRKKLDAEQYEARKEQERQRQRRLAEAGRDIGPIPNVVDPERRARCRSSLRLHLETYHAQTYTRAWASYHYALFDKLELAILSGGWFAMAVPRGGGKTAICEGAVEWALLHGHKRWPMFIGATEPKAEKSLRNIKAELQLNPLLLEDFPEVCYAIQALEGSARRCEGQLCCGFPTRPYWGTHQVVMPTLSPEEFERWASENFDAFDLPRPVPTFGNRVSVAGLTGSIRGLSEKTANLEMIRPDFALADDPQTRESAKSFTQNAYRFSILTGDVAYLSGGQQKMSVICPCTVIYKNDLADQLLDPNINPEWQAERHRMLITLPDRMDLWGEYAEIRRECLRLKDSRAQRATDFYIAHREQMDLGAESSWPERFYDDEISAIQNAMNLKIKDEVAWWAEAQNEPIADAVAEALLCPLTSIMTKQSHTGRYVFPHYVEKTAAHIDVQGSILYYAVGGASTSFETAIVDYGSLPDQKRNYYSLKEDLRTLQDEFPGETPEVAIYRGIQAAIAQLATYRYLREDGAEMPIGKILVDCGFLPATVIKACRESPFSSLVLPVQGISVRAKDMPLALRKKKDGETKGHEWIIKPKPDTPSVRYGQVNANAYKSSVHTGFGTTTGPGSLSLWKDRAERHRMAAEHCHAEDPKRVTVSFNDRDSTVIEWDEKPDHPDNHHFDNFANVLAGLSMQGCVLPDAHDAEEVVRRRTPKKITAETLASKRR